jgi:hypothetical protein
MNLNFAYIEFIKYNKPNMKLSIDEYWEKQFVFFNGQKLKRLVQLKIENNFLFHIIYYYSYGC